MKGELPPTLELNQRKYLAGPPVVLVNIYYLKSVIGGKNLREKVKLIEKLCLA